MQQKILEVNKIDFQPGDIQYVPQHKCPLCGARPKTTKEGYWLVPYQDWYNTPLSGWVQNLGYAHFWCGCEINPGLRFGSMRVARLGDAIIPVIFDDGKMARDLDVEPAWLNALRVGQAVAFLAKNADPSRTAGEDQLAYTLYAVSAGLLSPDKAREQICEMLVAGEGATAIPVAELVEL